MTHHGDSMKGRRTKLYGVWATMLSRCHIAVKLDEAVRAMFGTAGTQMTEDQKRAWANDMRDGM